jgi:hypothetical protein
MLASPSRPTALALVAATLVAANLVACGGAEEEFDEDDGSFDSAYTEGKEDTVRSARFEVFAGADGKQYFHLLAPNGQKVLASQGYTSTAAARDGIASVKAGIGDDSRVATNEASNGQYSFTVKSSNGQVVAVSELYASRSNATRAITSIRSSAKTATTVVVRPTSKAAVQVFKGLDGQYYFHVRATNGQILAQSESYATRAGSVSGSASALANGAAASRYEIRDARDSQAYFVLKAANGELLAHSELFATRSNATRARDAFVALAQSGAITAAK